MLLIGIEKREGQGKFFLALIVSMKDVEVFEFDNLAAREAFADKIVRDPMSYFKKHLSESQREELTPFDARGMSGIPSDAKKILRVNGLDRPISRRMAESGEYGLCVPCSQKEQCFVWHEVPSMTHTNDMVEQLKAAFSAGMKKAMQIEMTHEQFTRLDDSTMNVLTQYAYELLGPIRDVAARFIAAQQQSYEDMQRDPITAIRRFPSILEAVSQTDRTEWPLFPEEVEEWVSNLRKEYNYPFELAQMPFRDGVFEQYLTMEEMLWFCIYLESKCDGAGMDMFGGKKR